MPVKRCLRSTFAFSLIETVLALGLIGFGLVAILGLMPVGLSTFRDAVDKTAEAQIAQGLLSQIQQTNHSILSDPTNPAYPGGNHYFDDRGAPLPRDTDAKYEANVTIRPTTILPGNFVDNQAVTVVVTTRNLAKSGEPARFVSYVVNNGR